MNTVEFNNTINHHKKRQKIYKHNKYNKLRLGFLFLIINLIVSIIYIFLTGYMLFSHKITFLLYLFPWISIFFRYAIRIHRKFNKKYSEFFDYQILSIISLINDIFSSLYSIVIVIMEITNVFNFQSFGYMVYTIILLLIPFFEYMSIYFCCCSKKVHTKPMTNEETIVDNNMIKAEELYKGSNKWICLIKKNDIENYV